MHAPFFEGLLLEAIYILLLFFFFVLFSSCFASRIFCCPKVTQEPLLKGAAPTHKVEFISAMDLISRKVFFPDTASARACFPATFALLLPPRNLF
jgi:hypothetical protein